MVTDDSGALDTASTTVSALQNLVSNPSFEGSTTGWIAYSGSAIARGLCADLGDSPADTAEFHRRAQEVALLLRSVGVPVLIEI